MQSEAMFLHESGGNRASQNMQMTFGRGDESFIKTVTRRRVFYQNSNAPHKSFKEIRTLIRTNKKNANKNANSNE